MLRIAFLLLLAIPVFGQNTDSVKVFSLDEFLRWVRTYHPVMQQVALLENQARSGLLEARGAFDPKWYGDYEDKSFNQKNYFRIGEAGLKIPTWWGVDVKMAYLWSSGDYLNPEGILPENGQAIAGVEVPLLQGMIFDQRRAQVQQAKLFKDANEATRRSLVNDLLLKAIESYWEWAYNHQMVRIYESSLQLAEDRFQIIRESFRQGDKPAIDTLESLIQVQDRLVQLNQAKVELQNATLELSNYLWYEDLVPLELELSTLLQPESLSTNRLEEVAEVSASFFRSLPQSHPQLQALMIKQKQLVIKEKWKREQLKPKLNFSYNFLGDGLDLSPENTDRSNLQNLFSENYKWALHFSFPLLLRKERGGLQLIRLEQLDTEYKLKDKELQIANKIRSILQQLETTKQQINTNQEVVTNYRRLLDAENEKFRIGESSIFLLNSREQKLIESQMKLNKLQTSFQKLYWKLEWAKGVLR